MSDTPLNTPSEPTLLLEGFQPEHPEAELSPPAHSEPPGDEPASAVPEPGPDPAPGKETQAPRRSLWSWLFGGSKRQAPHPEYSPKDVVIRDNSARFIQSLLPDAWLVYWQWLAFMGGSSQRGHSLVSVIRFLFIAALGAVFALAFYSLLAVTLISSLVKSMDTVKDTATATFDAVLTKMKADYPKDAGRLAKVTFGFKSLSWRGGSLTAKLTIPSKDANQPEPLTESLCEVTPSFFPFYHVESRLSGQALVRILVASSNEARGDGETPDEKAVDRYQSLLLGGKDNASLEKVVAELGKSPSYLWSRRFSGVIQTAIFVLFGCFLASICIRAGVDYGFDRWLWARTGKDDEGSVDVPAYFDLRSRLQNDDAMRGYFHKVDAAVQEVQARCRCSGHVLDSISLHMRREVVAALCQTDYQRLDAAKSFVESTAKSYSDKFYANTGIARFLLWCLPTAGFVGTTYGIGEALGNANLLQSVSLFFRESGRSIVSTSISVAFDSTFVGLILSMLGMLIIHVINGNQDNYVHEIASEVNDAVTNAKFFGRGTYHLSAPQPGIRGAGHAPSPGVPVSTTMGHPFRLLFLVFLIVIFLTLLLRPDLGNQAILNARQLFHQYFP